MLLEELTADLPPAGSDIDLIVASRQDATLMTVCEWVQSGVVPAWSECTGLSPESRCWRLQIGKYGGEIMASPGSSIGSFSACRTEPGASGYDPQIS